MLFCIILDTFRIILDDFVHFGYSTEYAPRCAALRRAAPRNAALRRVIGVVIQYTKNG